MKKVAILGAHSAVAKSLVECIRERDLSVDLVCATTTEHIGPGLELISEAVIGSADLLVLAMKGPLVDAIVSKISDRPILDLAGVGGDFSRVVEGSGVPSFAQGNSIRSTERSTRTRRSEDFSHRFFGLDPAAKVEGRVRIPVGLAWPIASALASLSAFGPKRASIVALESAASADQAGIDELSEQVRALFNMKDADAPVFGRTLAFNLLPSDGGPLEVELRCAIEAGIVLPMDLAVQRVLVPTFAADAAVVDVLVEDEAPSKETVIEALAAARGLHHAEDVVAADAIGRDDALVGGVVVGRQRIGMFIASDRLRRGSATSACLAIEKWLA